MKEEGARWAVLEAEYFLVKGINISIKTWVHMRHEIATGTIFVTFFRE